MTRARALCARPPEKQLRAQRACSLTIRQPKPTVIASRRARRICSYSNQSPSRARRAARGHKRCLKSLYSLFSCSAAARAACVSTWLGEHLLLEQTLNNRAVDAHRPSTETPSLSAKRPRAQRAALRAAGQAISNVWQAQLNTLVNTQQ